MANTLEEIGYIVLPDAITDEDLLEGRRWIESVTERSSVVPEALEPVYEVDGSVRKIRRLAFYDPDFWRPWIRRSGLSQLTSEILGGQCSLILHASFKKPALVGSPVVPHQDQALWDTPYPGAITAWIALEDATIENGCLEMYPGSHKNGLIPHNIKKTENWHQAIDTAVEGLSPKPIPMKAGDIILWHRYMAHSSGANLSDRDRMAMVMVFADATHPEFKAYDCLTL
ncbi:phytanoyl-CoA dioxygenase family protein [Thalassospira povalilytica]|uniref:phytanoyl-CoA dioxygenase family protein n=1 Tax=Thalassospira povalilytica TaxID=732237 RepID=UPI001D195A4D|nr:phytanoyl-CoA dioxygenase family protein [Thalassospira povalilytica]MCC4242079.1 phytanoyl-CoA dioxygenase family protein [Thalassospira povalilytica]